MKNVTTADSRSESGMAHHTPQLPSHGVDAAKNRGSSKSPGTKKSSCRESDRKTA